MPGVRALRKLQFGKETTAGTIVAATTVWRGRGTLQDDRVVSFPDEDIGILGKTTRAYQGQLRATLALDDVPATFEQLPYLLTSGVMALTTGVADSTGSGKVYTYDLGTTAQKTPTSFTIEGGDDAGAEVMEYCVLESLKLTGKPGDALMMGGQFFGRQVAVQAFTGSVAVPTVEEMLFSKCKLYIDVVSGTMGTTLKSNTLLGMTLNLKTGFQPVFTADGNLYFTLHKQAEPELTVEVTFEHETSGIAEKAAWRAGTPRQLQFLLTGSTLTTAGNYTTKTLKIGVAGVWEKFAKLDEQDGNDILNGTMRCRYDPTCQKFGQFIVVNQNASLT